MKKTAITILKIAVSIGLYLYIFKKIDLSKLWEHLRGAEVSYFIAAIAVYFLIQGLSAWRWYLLLRPLDIRAPYTKLLQYYLLGMLFNNFMPTGIGGDVFRIYYLHKDTGRLSRATASVFFDRNLGMAALLLMATVSALIAGTKVQGVRLAPLFILIGVLFALANLALFYRPTYNLLHRLLTMLKMKRADERVEHLFWSVNSYRGQWRLIASTMVISLAVQLGCSVVNVLCADAIGLETRGGWVNYLVFIPAIGLISMIPVSVNGMGWREFSYIVLFGSVGVDESHAAALAFLWLGVLVITSLPGGVIYALQGLRSKERLPSEEEILDAVEGEEKMEKADQSYEFADGAQTEEQPASTL
jgi:hypothetical protein